MAIKKPLVLRADGGIGQIQSGDQIDKSAIQNLEQVISDVATLQSGKEDSGVAAGLITAAIGVSVQAYHATLTALAGVATTEFGRGLLALANVAALRTLLAMPVTTTAGRLARFTGTDGALGQTSQLIENASGDVVINERPAQTTSILTLARTIGGMFERPPSASLNNVNWRHIVNQNPFTDGSGVGGENYANEVTALGWNLSDIIGVPAVAGTPAIWDNWEFKYNIGGFYNLERHMEYVDTFNVRHRYFSAALRHDGSYDQSGFFLDYFFLHNKAGVAKVVYDLANNAISVGDATTGLSTYHHKNALPPHKQRNGANSGWLNLPYFDSLDRCNIEGQVLQNGAAPATGGIGWSMNWSGTPGHGAVFFASQCGTDAGNATLTGALIDGKTNWDMMGRIRNLKTGTQYSSAVWDTQTSSSNGMAYMRCGYDAGQQWSIGMRDTQNFVLSASQNLLSSQVFSVNKTNLNVAFDKAPKLPSYTVAGVPSASTYGAGSLIYVSNESGGACVAFSDGTNWRRVTDRAIIS